MAKSQMLILGLAGPARCGKSTAARYLRDEYGFGLFALADPIKRAARTVFPHWTEWHLEGPGKDLVDQESGVMPRAVLQELGSGGRRVVEDLWVRVAELELRRWHAEQLAESFGPIRGALWADVRYSNEAQWVRDKGGMLVHIRRVDAEPVRAHESEAGLTPGPDDLVIRNDGTIEALHAALDGVVIEARSRVR